MINTGGPMKFFIDEKNLVRSVLDKDNDPWFKDDTNLYKLIIDSRGKYTTVDAVEIVKAIGNEIYQL